MIRSKYMFTPLAWVVFNNATKHEPLYQRELLLFGIRIYIHTIFKLA